MKKNENKKTNRNRSLVALLVLCALLAVTLVGCKKPVAEKPSPSTSEVVSEVVSEEVSESTSEELSTEEVASEEVSEETMDLTLYTEANGKNGMDLINDMDYNEFKVVVWRQGYGAKTILSNGDSYKIEDENDFLYLYYPNQMQSVQVNMDYVEIITEYEKVCPFRVYGIGENIEVTFTGTDVDGKEYEITFYVTKDWKYEWE